MKTIKQLKKEYKKDTESFINQYNEQVKEVNFIDNSLSFDLLKSRLVVFPDYSIIKHKEPFIHHTNKDGLLTIRECVTLYTPNSSITYSSTAGDTIEIIDFDYTNEDSFKILMDFLLEYMEVVLKSVPSIRIDVGKNDKSFEILEKFGFVKGIEGFMERH
jgi:hypothetical protein